MFDSCAIAAAVPGRERQKLSRRDFAFDERKAGIRKERREIALAGRCYCDSDTTIFRQRPCSARKSPAVALHVLNVRLPSRGR